MIDSECVRSRRYFGNTALSSSLSRVTCTNCTTTTIVLLLHCRGFDPEGADRLQLLDAVMQLLDYEATTGEDLREMEYIPDYDAMLAAEKAAAEKAKLELEEAAAKAQAGEASHEAEKATIVDAEGEVLPGSDVRNPGEEVISSPYGTTEGKDDLDGEQAAQNMEPLEEATTGVMEGTGDVEGLEQELDQILGTSTLLGFVKDLGVEVLSTMKRDLNAIVGMLPGPVAKPIREVAAAVEDTAVRFVVPAIEQAERYTRGLRRGIKAAAGKVALRLRDEVCPRVGRNVIAALGGMKRRLVEALSKRGGGGTEEEDEAEGGQQHANVSA